MANGGFLIKFDGKQKPRRCYEVSFNYDEWSCKINNEEPKEMAKGINRIIIEVEVV